MIFSSIVHYTQSLAKSYLISVGTNAYPFIAQLENGYARVDELKTHSQQQQKILHLNALDRRIAQKLSSV